MTTTTTKSLSQWSLHMSRNDRRQRQSGFSYRSGRPLTFSSVAWGATVPFGVQTCPPLPPPPNPPSDNAPRPSEIHKPAVNYFTGGKMCSVKAFAASIPRTGQFCILHPKHFLPHSVAFLVCSSHILSTCRPDPSRRVCGITPAFRSKEANNGFWPIKPTGCCLTCYDILTFLLRYRGAWLLIGKEKCELWRVRRRRKALFLKWRSTETGV